MLKSGSCDGVRRREDRNYHSMNGWQSLWIDPSSASEYSGREGTLKALTVSHETFSSDLGNCGERQATTTHTHFIRQPPTMLQLQKTTGPFANDAFHDDRPGSGECGCLRARNCERTRPRPSDASGLAGLPSASQQNWQSQICRDHGSWLLGCIRRNQ